MPFSCPNAVPIPPSSEPGAEIDASPLADRSALVASVTGSPSEPLEVEWTVAEALEAHATRHPGA